MPHIIRIGGRTYKEVRTTRTRRNKRMPRNTNSYSHKLRELQSRRKYESEKTRFRQEQRIRRQQANARRKEQFERTKARFSNAGMKARDVSSYIFRKRKPKSTPIKPQPSLTDRSTY